MSNGTGPQVFASVRVIDVEPIDGGRTLAVRLEKADGGEVTVLLSQVLAEDLRQRVSVVLSSSLHPSRHTIS